jgi:(1->4)-alpha-D-glucan 1-alpha-D-glucosylmutase
MSQPRVPVSTYRLQFHAGWNFSQAQALTSYLHELGITDVYASPLFKASRGSLHGYSVTNPLQLNPELGTKAAFDSMCKKLRSLSMGLLLDVVPNHMALSRSNPWWQDVLENGQSSPYAVFFDIEWNPPYRSLKNRVLLPILGRPYGQCLEDQELQLSLTPDGFVVHYYDHVFPLDLHSYLTILTHRLEELKESVGENSPDFIRMMGVITLVQNLPPRTVASIKKKRERLHWRDVIKKSLWLLHEKSPKLREYMEENLRRFNGSKGDPASFDLLDSILRDQAYRLAHWLVSLEIINYRRFFSINDLIGIRVEDPQVFEATHNLLFRLVEDKKITGLRLDHIDGLNDPEGYLQRLQTRLQSITGAEEQDRFYLVTEKILEEGEPLPESWAVAGTTGYDFLGILNNIFLDDRGLKEILVIYRDFTGITATWEDVVYDRQKFIMVSLFGGEVHNLTDDLLALADKDRQAMDTAPQDLHQALIEISACLPVYRTYIRSYEVAATDRDYLEEAVAQARRRQPSLGEHALNFVRKVLLLEFPPGLPEDQKKHWLRFVCRWQQFTGPIMAKGLEDTAAYIYNPLVSLNEVGGYRGAVSPAEFHSFIADRQRLWPGTMNTTSTHDTKRSEDVRARLSVLTEMPEVWREHIDYWHAVNITKKRNLPEGEVPDRNEEILIYQTLLGVWPLYQGELANLGDRLETYLVKALREAKIHSRWIDPQIDYEQAVVEFGRSLLEDNPGNEFLPDFLELQGRVAYFGALNSLSQVLLKIASPGVPDFFQGNEIWDLSLVDPDNRRPVDFKRRQILLKEVKALEARNGHSLPAQLLANWRDGRLKLFITYKALQIRQAKAELFAQGECLPLKIQGPRQDHIIAFGRRLEHQWAFVLAGRFFSSLTEPEVPPLGPDIWRETLVELPQDAPRGWLDGLTGLPIASIGPTLALSEIFSRLPVALLLGSS